MLCIPVLQCFVSQYSNASLQVLFIASCALESRYLIKHFNRRTLTDKKQVSFTLFFFKNLYNTYNLPDLGWYLTIYQRAKVRSSPDVPLFYNHLAHEKMYTFLHKTNFLNFLSLLLPVLIFKNIPNWYYPVLGFRKITYHL